MALKKTKLLNVVTVSGISTVGILTVGTSPLASGVGIASTTYIRSVVLHSTSISTCKASIFLEPDTTPPFSGVANTSRRILSVDMNPGETFSYDTPYPIVMSGSDCLVVSVTETAGYSGIGSDVNVLLLGDSA
jgi:hypothetical protein